MSDEMYGAALAGLLLIPALGAPWDMWDTYRTLHPRRKE